MTIKELLLLDFKESNIEKFFALLFNQKIHQAFMVFSEFSINFNTLEDMSVYCLNLDGAIYYKLCYKDAPFLIYRFESDNCESAWCIDFESYKEALQSCVKAVDEKYIPMEDINKRIL